MLRGSGKIVGTTPSTLAINVTNALLDSHKHLGKDIATYPINESRQKHHKWSCTVLQFLFQSGNSGLMEEKAKNESTALASCVVKCQVITFMVLWHYHF